jgi:predicted TIM-barrel fold metal-dependent hydrolase
VESYRNSVNWKLIEGANAAYDFVYYGILDRYPGLKIVIVENEIGWIPFLLQQWDYYFNRFKGSGLPIDQLPSYYFRRQIFVTFFNDPFGTETVASWGADNCMWSNDFPHGNSTWPHSREWIAEHLGHLSPEVRARLVRENVVHLYDLTVPEPLG